jgi:uncharacterized membrane protein
VSPSGEFADYALQQQEQIEGLLAAEELRRGWLRLRRKPDRAQGDDTATARLHSPDLGDPEFVKNLRIFLRLVVAARELYERALRSPATEQRPQVLAREGELHRHVTLSPYLPVTLKLLLCRRFDLELLLIAVGDREYLAGRLADVFNEERGTISTWQSLYGDQLPALLPGGTTVAAATGAPGVDEVAATRERLERLMRVKRSEDEVYRARWELKQRAAWLAIVVLLVVIAAFAAVTAAIGAEDGELLAAAAAGAAGATLGGLIRLREQVTLGAQVRQFRPFFFGQVLVGVAAGAVAFLVDQSGIVAIAGGSAGVAAVGFALGFSEAAFVGLLARLGGTVAG